MRAKLHLTPLPPRHEGEEIALGYILEGEGFNRQHSWIKIPQKRVNVIRESCDAYVIATIFQAMEHGADLMVHGEVSPSLLEHLEEFMAAWQSWVPKRYRMVDIQVEVEREALPAQTTDALTVFSGGVDSCFTLWRHNQGLVGRGSRPIKAGIFLHGFDIPLREGETYARAAEKVETMLNSVGVALIRMRTNLRKTSGDFSHSHGAILAAALHVLKGDYAAGLIPSTHVYKHLILPFGTNPITDRMLSSKGFRIIHDGAAFTRSEKAAALADWPQALEHLRVCLQREGQARDENCCRCEKCLRTILNFRAVGVPRPPAFARDASLSQILCLNYAIPSKLNHFRGILEEAHRRKLSGSWLVALRLNFLWNSLKVALKKKRP